MEQQPVYHSSNNDVISMMEWQVSRIQGHRKVRGVNRYHVVWKPSWEPAHRLQHMAKEIDAWNKAHDYADYGRQPLRQPDPVLSHWSGKVIDREERDGQTYYKIEWENTEEPEANLENAQALLNEYLRRRRT
ncbi:hypothetical protein CGCFRS4_v015715 [Colletotrichum fructicola]|nr:hypothetical protein CGCFRS4_v015715 [Colletotrichum fructicola]